MIGCTAQGRNWISNLSHTRQTLYQLGHHLLIVAVYDFTQDFYDAIQVPSLKRGWSLMEFSIWRITCIWRRITGAMYGWWGTCCRLVSYHFFEDTQVPEIVRPDVLYTPWPVYKYTLSCTQAKFACSWSHYRPRCSHTRWAARFATWYNWSIFSLRGYS